MKIDACALLTKADAGQIPGKPVNDPTHPVTGNETFSVDSCEYKMTGGTAMDNATLSTSTQKGDAPSQALIDLAKVVLGRIP